MKKIIIVLLSLLVILSIPVNSRQAGWTIVSSSGAPGGSCNSFQANIDTATGDLWSCNGTTWRLITTPVYNVSGTVQIAAHAVMGTVTLVLGTASATFTGKAAFASSSSYICTATDATGLNLTQIVRNSGSSITVNGVLTDAVQFVCVGN